MIEFALCFPVFLLALFMMLEIGLIRWQENMISDAFSQAAQVSSRGCLDGQVAAGTCTNKVDYNYLLGVINGRSLGLMNPSNLCFRATPLSYFTVSVQTGNPAPAPVIYDLGLQKEAVLISGFYNFPVMFPWLSSIVGTNFWRWKYYTIIRNDAFGVLGFSRSYPIPSACGAT